MGVGGQCYVLVAVNSRKHRYPFYRLGGPYGWFGPVRKISPSPGFDPRTLQYVVSCYTDCAIPAHVELVYIKKILPLLSV
jgi:hypothetical protein